MSTRVFLVKRPYGALAPARPIDADLIAQYPVGATIRADLTLPKSPDMLRWYWALVGYVAKGLGRDREDLSHELLLRTGRFASLILTTGATHAIPRSIAAMQYPAFRAYVDDAVQLILEDFLPHMERGALLAEVQRMTGTDYSEFKDEAASGDAAGPAEVPASGQAHTDTPPLAPDPGGVGTDAGLTSRAPASVPTSQSVRDYDARLAHAAENGMDALKAVWAQMPREAQTQLKAALDRRHKPAAARADQTMVTA